MFKAGDLIKVEVEPNLILSCVVHRDQGKHDTLVSTKPLFSATGDDVPHLYPARWIEAIPKAEAIKLAIKANEAKIAAAKVRLVAAQATYDRELQEACKVYAMIRDANA